MPGLTTETAFETYVVEILLTRGGWKSGSNVEWDREQRLFPAQVFAFIAEPKLWAETAKLDALVGKVEAAVERLQEYRTALITAAVTGKIDVRKEVAA